MKNVTNKLGDIIHEKLSEVDNNYDLGISRSTSIAKKPKRLRRVAEPHIFSRKRGDYVFYYYARGIDKEVYLGTADHILKAVKGK